MQFGPEAEERRVVMLCLDSILDSIVWFWSTVIAGLLPAISTASILEPDRSDYLSHLRILLKDPLCTNESRDFAASLAAMSRSMSPLPPSGHPFRFDSAAVQLSHGQILASSHGDGPCLNWIGMDQVACLTEIHLLAMYMGLSQVHLAAEEVLSSPMQLLNMASRHRASRTFAPHSFLAKYSRELASEQTSSLGETNMVDVCERLQTQLEKYSACKHIIVLDTSCPTYDRDQKHQHAAADESISGLQLRVELLELSGDVVLGRYDNNRESTVAAFTDDDWFTTGDLACVNQDGQDTIIVNVAKYSSNELERHLELELIEGAVPNSFCCFSTLAQSSDTEQIVEDNTRIRTKTRNRIAGVVSTHTSSSVIVLPLKAMGLKPSALVKLPRGTIKTAFENGAYNPELCKASEAYVVDPDVTGGRASHLEVLACRVVQEHFNIVQEPHRLVAVIEGFGNKDGAGSPAVTFRSDGRQTPLRLVLVFMNLVRFIDDRRVYAFRAEGLDSGLSPFVSLDELLDCFFNNLKTVQPKGLYAIAGHSYGSMIAFESCKRLEAAGNVAIYCGRWNLPPHIKHRMRQLGWVEYLANLFHFTGLMGQGPAMQQICILRQFSKQEAVAHLRALSDSALRVELGLSEDEYVRWASASSRQCLAQDYEPRGRVRSIDVFFADPLKKVALTREFADDVQFHDVPGEYYSMLDEINVSRFARKLKDLLETREGRLRHVLSAAPRFGPAYHT
ncbi:Alpha/Beta hydrolase protein [Colletotrichum godetiae]|uniref:Alpha/Beta hydrolase protein n=1 Tax=Colletotrichum godetiae TaxID=1209918 RepID=A0AAJ0A9Q1_9PEZI|nr:Alpha/Beta hydrolase protein [Colletotrichum godetiae]KAK1659097.1 Alpha/Beta hydrolase protein [Colletotrichum godetiae]